MGMPWSIGLINFEIPATCSDCLAKHGVTRAVESGRGQEISIERDQNG
jgi:hypothetical protein